MNYKLENYHKTDVIALLWKTIADEKKTQERAQIC